jgi:5'-methylthioadenosine phosphorylase
MKDGKILLGVIAGSGFEDGLGLENVIEKLGTTPFGDPSGVITCGTFPGTDVSLAFLPRHGRYHRILPGAVNSLANVYALKELGADLILGFCAVGSLDENLQPGDLTVPDQLIDRTWGRRLSYSEESGVAIHVSPADPFCPEMRRCLLDEPPGDVSIKMSGTLVCIQGPRFSTRAESKMYRQLGCDLIGMTATEAFVAREAELPYALVALVTDFDCWRLTHGAVDAKAVMDVMAKNVASAKRFLIATLPKLARFAATDCSCRRALANAIMTPHEAIMPAESESLDLLIGKHLRASSV